MPMPLRLPKTARGRILGAAAGLLALAVAGFLVVYFVLLPTSSPKPFRLSTSTSASSAPTAASASSTTTSAGTSAAASAQLAGRFTVASGSQAGYRVREKLGFLPAQSDAVGRTSAISGSALLKQSAGSVTVSGASIVVAVNTLRSDRSQRDEKIHEIGLESDRYPRATFAQSTPLRFSASALNGHVLRVAATGVFDIHGTSKTETLPLELRMSGSQLEAAGSLTFPWSEFNMTAPSIGGFVNVTGKATLEFDLRLRRG
jgi:polyisoprenoid-binding protein YceI